MATYLADRVVVYTGTPAVNCTALTPQSLVSGMNAFLKDLEITFRRDPTNHRPRINKLYSVKDKEQKSAGTYFYLDTDDEVDDHPLVTKEQKKKNEKAAAQAARDAEKEASKMSNAKERARDRREREEEEEKEAAQKAKESGKVAKAKTTKAKDSTADGDKTAASEKAAHAKGGQDQDDDDEVDMDEL